MLEKNNRNSVCLDQNGRSMVEMLGTLAIVGVLSAGAIGGYSYAMNKHRTNELIYEATKRAQWVGTQLEMNNPNPSLNTFGTDSFGGGTFTGEVVQLENGQIGIKVAGLKEAVCQNILNSIGDNTAIREMRDVNCNDDNGTATLVFNRDLSPSDPTISESDPEASGEVVGTTPEATETASQNPDDIHCSGNGSWNGSSCYCDPGYDGQDCSEINNPVSTGNNYEPEMSVVTTSGPSGDEECSYHGYLGNGATGWGCICDSGWGGTDCSTSNPCSGHGFWQNGIVAGCGCYSPWGGSDCSQDMSNVCNGHGTYIQAPPGIPGFSCSCDPGWSGDDCSTCTGSNCPEEQNDSPSTATATEYEPEETATVDHSCGEHQTWNGSSCVCESGWFGDDCSINGRETYCHNRGTWNGSRCTCDDDSDWIGGDCTCSGRAYYCNGNGTFNKSSWTCQCDMGWYGYTCETQDVRVACNNEGTWTGTGCECDPGASCLYGMDVLRPPASCL